MSIYHSTFTILLTLSTLFACQERKDILFGASDELHLIQLYKQGNEFELIFNGVNSAEGTYMISGHTIYLTYYKKEDSISNGKGSKLIHANEVLTRILVIDDSLKRINSIGGKQFCANIHMDKLNKKQHWLHHELQPH